MLIRIHRKMLDTEKTARPTRTMSTINDDVLTAPTISTIGTISTIITEAAKATIYTISAVSAESPIATKTREEKFGCLLICDSFLRFFCKTFSNYNSHQQHQSKTKHQLKHGENLRDSETGRDSCCYLQAH